MPIHLRQDLKLEQKLTMTPQLQQSIQLLLLTRAELEVKIEEALVENPLLEDCQDEVERLDGEENQYDTQDDFAPEPPPTEAEILDSDFAEILATLKLRPTSGLEEISGDFGSYATSLEEESSTPEDRMTAPFTLHTALFEQLQLSTLSREERRIASHIIGNIDARGYLTGVSLEDLVVECNEDNRYGYNEYEQQPSIDLLEPQEKETFPDVTVADVKRVLRFIQYNFEPSGIAARDLSETLLIQLERRHAESGVRRYTLATTMIRECIPLLGQRSYRKIAKLLNRPYQDVIDVVKMIQTFDPIPGRAYQSGVNHYIVPDIYIEFIDGELVPRTNEEGLPRLTTSRYYERIARSASCDALTRAYILDKLREAKFFIESIEERKKTIYKVTASIIKFQRDFFLYGPKCLRPLILKDIAKDIGVHESTVSRVTSNKYVETPRGLFELRYFFNSSIPRIGSEDEDFGSEAVRTKIRELIAAENGVMPLSDSRIVKILAMQDIYLSRRTVAKYRESMNILPSSMRKKFL